MTTLHTFGCSITQGFALPDVVQPLLNAEGLPLTPPELAALGKNFRWEDIHVYAPSKHAWPQVLGDQLGVSVVNYARRGACFQQIARQCAVAKDTIKPEDTVVVMWTYLSRLSFQWPARTSVPFGNLSSPAGWRTVMTGFNKFFGLSKSDNSTDEAEELIHNYIETATKETYLNPMGVYNRYYNSLVLQTMTDGFLRSTGARVIHLSVEPQSALDQLNGARRELADSLRTPYNIPDPKDWYTLDVDHLSSLVILDPKIPPAANDTHPSVEHHKNFAEHLHAKYFAS